MGIASMNASINSNRKLLKNGKRKPFTKMNGGSSKSKGYKPYVLPKLQPHVLKRIRLKVKRENRKLLIKKLVIGFITLVLMLLYAKYLIK
ncbi:hypothetical protein [Psychroserpens jangbogonensis]|uniref:hypothetical protein n=1 Tax=Psychroserpens jangbogonensis TaxID=1484460 RepID=UPI00053DE1FD|nr:hypothetical protein [Psychroserpens jangbogonensis]